MRKRAGHPMYTVGIRCIQPPDVFPLTSIVNKSRKIEYCDNKMLQVIQNVIVSQVVELVQCLEGILYRVSIY